MRTVLYHIALVIYVAAFSFMFVNSIHLLGRAYVLERRVKRLAEEIYEAEIKIAQITIQAGTSKRR